MKKKPSYLCLLLSLLPGSMAFAQPGLLDESVLFEEIPSVYTASKHEQPVTQAPAMVSVVTYDEIQKFGYRSLADILASMTGVFTSYDRVYQRVGIRGFNRPGDFNYRLLMMVDGHRINDNIVDYNAVGNEFVIDVDDIQRVELVRGPASSLYGSNAFFGVVNIITRQGRDIQGANVTGVFASQDTYKGKFTYGDKFANGAEVYVSGSHFQSQNDDRLPVAGLGTAFNMDREHAQRGFMKLSWQNFTLSGGHVSRDKRPAIPIAGTTLNDSRSNFADAHTYLDLHYQHRYDNGLDVDSRLYYDYIEFDGDYATVPETLYNDKFDGQWVGGELKLMQTLFQHHLTGGVEYRYNFQQRMTSREAAPLEHFRHADQTSHVVGVYLQDEYPLLDNLTLNVGVRYDHHKFVGGRFSPRAALIYQPWTKTTLKLIYGKAFRAPSVFERFYAFLDVWVPSSGLRPETIENVEFNWRQQLTRNIDLTVAPFHNSTRNLIELRGAGTPDDPVFFVNSASLKTTGVDVELNGHWADGWRATISYSFQHSNLADDPRFPTNSPKHLAKLNLNAPVWHDRLFASVNVNYLSGRNTFVSSVADRTQVNLSLHAPDVLPGLTLTGTLFNVFDTRFEDPSTTDLAAGRILQDGQLLWLKASYSF
ncbi:MAG: TonB-dependent receptor [Methylococcales bacterium]|nr:TonB-dependent receptor [Methylococcales bacterium]